MRLEPGPGSWLVSYMPLGAWRAARLYSINGKWSKSRCRRHVGVHRLHAGERERRLFVLRSLWDNKSARKRGRGGLTQAPARRKRTGTGASRTPADVRPRPARQTAAGGADGAGAGADLKSRVAASTVVAASTANSAVAPKL